MTNEKNHENALAKSTENSYTKKENSVLEAFNQIFYDSQEKNYTDTKRELLLYSKNNSIYQNTLFYRTFV